MAHPNFKNGVHSRYLPKHLAKDYSQAVSDPDLLSMRSQAALLTTREMELTRQLSEMEAPAWNQAVTVLGELETAMESKDKTGLQKAFGDLKQIIRDGADGIAKYSQTWSELRQVIQEKARLSQAESKRLEQVGGYVKTEDLMLVLFGILEAVKTHVQDSNARQAIQTRFNALIDSRSLKHVDAEVVNG
jgi:hypothetical protein